MKKILFLLVATLVLVGCQSKSITGETVSSTSGTYQNITPAELSTMLERKDFVLVNVHIPFAGDIPGTDISFPYNEIEQNLDQLPADKTSKIVLYCSSGRMSEIVADELVSMGYTNVWNLKGGMVDWQQAGFELEK
jgi:phage shock protein E